tara:strand:- start:136 stop:1818 length:1683 start_codon:yes stop_codon:yes gene_type:complete
MKIFFNGWFGGFFDKTNPGLHVQFFLDLFKKVYNEVCEVGTWEESEILCEFCMLISTTSKINSKKWKHTFMMSGENDCRACENQKDKYDCVLWMERNNKNIINLPLHIAYLYTNDFVNKLENQEKRTEIPKYDALVIISNPKGEIRNKFLNLLEKKMKVTYAGRYKNNTESLLPYDYNTNEFKEYVSQYKFIISMENTRYETGITEKIVHGMLAQTVPVYWGSLRVYDYFNKERLLNLEDDSIEGMNKIIEEMISIKNNDQKWLNIVNNQVFSNDGKLWRTMDDITDNIKCLLFKKKWNHIDKILLLSNKIFEPERYNRLNDLFYNKFSIDKSLIKFICPTYKQTITDEMIKKYVKQDFILNLRNVPTKNAELSLVLNYRETLKYIEKNYKDGIFCILESDVYPLENINNINDFFEIAYKNKNEWDVIHFGYGAEDQLWTKPFFDWADSPYRKKQNFPVNLYNEKNQVREGNKFYIEDFTNKESKVRFLRHFSTRCTDTLLWSYNGVKKMLKFMEDENYIAMDYYFTNKFESDNLFKHYWTDKVYFLQGSNYNIEKSTIQ